MNDQRDGGIAWTDFTSSPLRYHDAAGKSVWGCVKVSPGCAHCYSEALAHRYGKGGPFTKATMDGLTPYLDEKEMRTLLTSKKISGKRVFLADMTDLFGDWVPDEMIAALFGVMAARPDVTWQILTKRAERMLAWFDGLGPRSREDRLHPAWFACHLAAAKRCNDYEPATQGRSDYDRWPLPNVHVGVSVEDQATADERIPLLLQCPAAVRWVSYEPAIGPVDMARWMWPTCCSWDARYGTFEDALAAGARAERIRHSLVLSESRFLDWVVVGGESGPGARPFDLAWARSIIGQCREANVPVFCKQLGSRPFETGVGLLDDEDPDAIDVCPVRLKDRKGGDPSEWPADLRVREFPESTT
jgi:protein gp37